MSKIIIENRSSLDNMQAMSLVSQVVASGRISNDGKQYCYYSTGAVDGKPIGVDSFLNKKSDRFVVVDQQ